MKIHKTDIKKEIGMMLAKRHTPPKWQQEKIDLARRIVDTEEKLIAINIQMHDTLIYISHLLDELVYEKSNIHKQEVLVDAN